MATVDSINPTAFRRVADDLRAERNMIHTLAAMIEDELTPPSGADAFSQAALDLARVLRQMTTSAGGVVELERCLASTTGCVPRTPL